MKTVLLATVCLGVVTSSALAWDWRVKSTLGQTLEINDNRDMRINPLGVTYAPVTSLLLDILARTPTDRLAMSGNLNYRTYFGPGSVNDMNALDKDAQARYTKTTKLTTYDIGGSWSQRDAGTLQLEDTGFRTVRGSVTTYAVDGGFKHQFGVRDSLIYNARGTSVNFTSPTESPYNDFTSNATWLHRATRTLDLNTMVNYYFQDRETSQTTIWRTTTGGSARLSPRLTVNGSTGAAFVSKDSSNGTVPPPSSTSPFNGSGSAVGWIGDIALTYRIRATTRFSFAAARTVSPDALGDIQARDVFSVGLVEEINRRSSLAFTSSLSRNSGSGGTGTGSGTSEFFNASATYSYRLTPEVFTAISYRYAQRNDDNGTARSNSVFMSVRRDVTILP